MLRLLHVADFSFLEGLFSTLPFASDDVEARGALWSVIARLLARVNESEIDTSCVRQYILVFLRNSDIIEDDLLDIQLEEDPKEESLNSFPSQGKSSARRIAVSTLIFLCFCWSYILAQIFSWPLVITDTKDWVDVEQLEYSQGGKHEWGLLCKHNWC